MGPFQSWLLLCLRTLLKPPGSSHAAMTDKRRCGLRLRTNMKNDRMTSNMWRPVFWASIPYRTLLTIRISTTKCRQCARLYYTMLSYTTIILYYIILHSITLYYIILYYSIVYYTIPYYTILYYDSAAVPAACARQQALEVLGHLQDRRAASVQDWEPPSRRQPLKPRGTHEKATETMRILVWYIVYSIWYMVYIIHGTYTRGSWKSWFLESPPWS